MSGEERGTNTLTQNHHNIILKEPPKQLSVVEDTPDAVTPMLLPPKIELHFRVVSVFTLRVFVYPLPCLTNGGVFCLVSRTASAFLRQLYYMFILYIHIYFLYNHIFEANY